MQINISFTSVASDSYFLSSMGAYSYFLTSVGAGLYLLYFYGYRLIFPLGKLRDYADETKPLIPS